jgi:hypothetical protein
MPRAKIINGEYVFGDIYFATALACENGVRVDGVVDYGPDGRVLPAAELSRVYIEVIERRKRVKKRGGGGMPGAGKRQKPRGHLEYAGPDGQPKFRTVRVPVVMFAFKPYKGNFGLHELKQELWHSADLHTPDKTYALEHAVLRHKISRTVEKFRRQTGKKDLYARFRGLHHEISSGGGRIEVTESEDKEVPRVSVGPDDSDE